MLVSSNISHKNTHVYEFKMEGCTVEFNDLQFHPNSSVPFPLNMTDNRRFFHYSRNMWEITHSE